ncbi:carbohydrate kinase [Mesorhizobium sp. NBSH29]|uniref:carbohydrate kinase family protein n=1 Tax=Mesorhizobium sp. NBSH29 TaxID=2654249 RepID=UPI0018964657|nr:carbohydrate kinase family protein [Mesorhizobium sp. NBSH29]QPC87936.1 carbohydrate kinase [Mesorhizobium sp. NBSH29]
MTTMPHLLAIGGAHIDRRGRITKTYVPGVSNPGVIDEEVGGVVFNALRNAVRRGVSASLVSIRGGDSAGTAVAHAIAQAGITDLSAIFLDRPTPSYTALLDHEGDLIAGLADMGLYDMAFPKQLARASVRKSAGACDAILCDANLPPAALARVMALATGKPVYAIAISPAKVVRLHGMLKCITCLFMNRHEAEALTGHPGSLTATLERLRAIGLGSAVVTAGGAPVAGFDAGGLFSIAPPPARNITDVTGAGDALAGVTVAAAMRGLALREALREGLAAAYLTVESRQAVASFSENDFAAALALVPHAQPLLSPA